MLAKTAPTPRAPKMPSEDRRRQLLRVAIDTFARNGFSGTKTKDIAAAAEVSEAILFRHFASKEDLYHAILDMKGSHGSDQHLIKELRAFANLRDDAGLFRHLATHIVASFRDDPAFQRLMLYATLEGHLLAHLFRERFALPTGNFLMEYVALRQKEGAFRKGHPAVLVTFAIGPIVQYAMGQYVFAGKKRFLPDDTVVEELTDLVMSGIVSRDAKGATPKLVNGKLVNGKIANGRIGNGRI
jgi:TetR/AcrR family transcriptional regulator